MSDDAIAIRVLQPAELDRADALLGTVFGRERGFHVRLRRYLAIEPEGWFVAEQDGELVGALGANTHGEVAYLGLMAVAPARQHRGIGRRLLAHTLGWLDGRGVACAMLDATEVGARLYQQLGFVEIGPSHELVGAAADLRHGERPAGDDLVTAVTARDLDELIALDRQLFGAARVTMWQRLLDEERGRILIARDGAALTGYLCVQPHTLGPWGTLRAPTAQALLAASRDLPTEPQVRVLVPGENTGALAFLLACGFREVRRVRHMRRGDLATPLSWKRLHGKASFCLG
jgi:predicted N-acetyltransferase YhbS